MKKIILTLCLVCFGNYSLSQDDFALFDDLFEESEDIACEDLPEAFKRYDEDRNLNQTAMERSLTQTIQTLKDISEKEDSRPKKDLSELVERLEEAVSLSQSNSFIFFDKADNISYFLTDCSSEKIELAEGNSNSQKE